MLLAGENQRPGFDRDRLVHGDMTGEGARPPPDCRGMVIRLRYGVKGGCARRATSTGEKCLVNVHVKPPMTPSLRRMDRQQSVRWGRGGAQGPEPGRKAPSGSGRGREPSCRGGSDDGTSRRTRPATFGRTDRSAGDAPGRVKKRELPATSESGETDYDGKARRAIRGGG